MAMSFPDPSSVKIGYRAWHVWSGSSGMQTELLHKQVLSAIRTATAPARCAFRTLCTKVQSPRSTCPASARGPGESCAFIEILPLPGNQAVKGTSSTHHQNERRFPSFHCAICNRSRGVAFAGINVRTTQGRVCVVDLLLNAHAWHGTQQKRLRRKCNGRYSQIGMACSARSNCVRMYVPLGRMPKSASPWSYPSFLFNELGIWSKKRLVVSAVARELGHNE